MKASLGLIKSLALGGQLACQHHPLRMIRLESLKSLIMSQSF